MAQSEFIAALDLGTSKMIAMVGKKNEQGMLSVIESEKINSGACMRKGYVYNVGETAEKVGLLISGINNRLNPKINKVYVGVGGQSLHLELYSAFRPVDGIIDDSVLLSMEKECSAYDPELYEVIEILSPEYYLDNRLTAEPKGLECKKIEARYKLILGRPSIKNNLEVSIEQKAKIDIAGFFVSPIASAEAVLVEREKELGCALIEFGAGVTYVSVYKNSLLKHLVTIPVGGDVITKDITTMNVLDDEAENLKVNWGCALVDPNNQVKIDEYPKIRVYDLDVVIEARLDEILANVLEQIKASGFGDVLGSGIVITGGGANLKKIADSIRKKSGMEVRIAAIKESIVDQAVDWANDNSNAEIVGLLMLGEKDCSASAPVTDKKGQIPIFPEEVVKEDRPGRGTRKPQKNDPVIENNNTSSPQGGNRKSIFDKIKIGFDKMGKDLFDGNDGYEESGNSENSQDGK